MISSIGRVCAILMTMFSVAFMAFAISRWATIPDRASEARNLDEFTLARTEGETPTWSASTRLTGEAVLTSSNMSAVLEAMYKRGTQDATTEVELYRADMPAIETAIGSAKESITQDKTAMATKVSELLAEMKTMQDEVTRLTSEAEIDKANAQKLQVTRERRRSDVYRLREELAQIEADQFRATQLQKQLTDMLRRVQGNVIKLQTRQQQLKKSL